MSVVFSEGLDRFPSGKIPNGRGILGKAVDIVCVHTPANNTTGVNVGPQTLGRQWIFSAAQSQPEQGQTSNCYLRLSPRPAPIDDSSRAAPGLPAWPASVKKVTVSWKAYWGNGDKVLTGNACYLASVGNAPLYVVPGTVGNYLTEKGYFPCEMVIDLVTKKVEFYVNNVLQMTAQSTAGDEPRINLTGMRVKLGNGQLVGGYTYVTDICVVYDDGVAPNGRVGDVTVRDLPMEKVLPAHPDVEIIGGIDISAVPSVFAADVGTKLVGNGTKEVYRPKAASPNLGSGLVLSVVTDIRREASTAPIPADVQTKIIGTNGNTAITERPTTSNLNLQSVIRTPPGGMTPAKVLSDIKVEIAAITR